MESAVVKHSIVIAGHRTSVSLEKEFWNALKEIAHTKHMTLSDLVVLIDSDRQHANLSSAIRLFVLGFYRHQNWLGASKRQSGRQISLADVDGRLLPARLRDGVARLLSPYL